MGLPSQTEAYFACGRPERMRLSYPDRQASRVRVWLFAKPACNISFESANMLVKCLEARNLTDSAFGGGRKHGFRGPPAIPEEIQTDRRPGIHYPADATG